MLKRRKPEVVQRPKPEDVFPFHLEERKITLSDGRVILHNVKVFQTINKNEDLTPAFPTGTFNRLGIT